MFNMYQLYLLVILGIIIFFDDLYIGFCNKVFNITNIVIFFFLGFGEVSSLF